MSDFNVLGLSRRERQIMEILHQRQEASASDVRASLQAPPSYSAVRTHLRILEEKGWITHRKVGLRYVYEPVQSTEKASRHALAGVVKTFFGGSLSQAVAALVDNEKGRLSEEELRRIEAIIKGAKSSSPKKTSNKAS